MADEAVPFVRLQARDLKVTSLLMVDLRDMDRAHTGDATNRAAVRVRQVSRLDQALPVGQMLDDVLDGFVRELEVLQGGPFPLAELGAADRTAEQEAVLRSISFADTEGLVTRLAVDWTGGVQAAETGE